MTGINGILAFGGENGGMGFMFIYLIIMMVVIFFFSNRSQKKEEKRLNAMLSTLAIGDSILTNSGFYGVVIDIGEETVIVEFGSNKNCRIPMQKNCIARVEKADV